MKIYKFAGLSILSMLIMFMFTVPSFADVDATAEATGNAINNQTFEASKRGYAIQGQINYPGMPGYFGDNNKPGHQFVSLNKLLMYSTTWEITGEPANVSGKDYNFTPYKKAVAPEDRVPSVICTKDIFDTTKVEVVQLGVGACNATNKGQLSSDLFELIKYKAYEMGATHIQFLAEGTNTELQSSGWGIGINYTKATDTSVSTGGTGFSTGWSGYQNLPWQQFFFLKVVDPNAVAEITPEVVEEAPAVEADVVVDEQVDKAVKNAVSNEQTGNHVSN